MILAVSCSNDLQLITLNNLCENSKKGITRKVYFRTSTWFYFLSLYCHCELPQI